MDKRDLELLKLKLAWLEDLAMERGEEVDRLGAKVVQLQDDNDDLRRLAAIGREIEWEIDTHGDPYLMGVVARVECGVGFTQ